MGWNKLKLALINQELQKNITEALEMTKKTHTIED
jgi:hypothetical protein